MNNFSLKNCEKRLKELDNFTKNTDNEIDNILSILDWSSESLKDKYENDAQCPLNSAHRFPKESLEYHTISCQWKAEGYNKLDTPLSEPTLPPDAPSTIKIDSNIQKDILLTAKQKDPNANIGVGDRLIPRTSDRIFSDFTSDERRAIYDYVIANTQKVEIGQDIADLNKTKAKEEQKSLSHLELIAQERNLKRRRPKHRGVHTNKKSHIEVMREVIEQQMEMFKEYLSEKQNFQGESTEQMSQEVISNSSRNSRVAEVNFENRRYSFDRSVNYYQREEVNERCYKEDDRREHYAHHSDRKNSHHRSYKQDKYRSTSKERHKSRDKFKHRDRSRDRRRKRSKDKHRSRSKERKESRHDRRDRKRSRSMSRR